MPLYEFECRDCGRFEASRPIDRALAPLRCPTCRRQAPRVLSAVAIGRGHGGRGARAPTTGAEPRRVVKPAGTLQGHAAGHAPHPAHGRPWMMGH